ncbi:MAG: DUF2383 domain-containing protein [Candidatus Melainabacteria bacterium]|nr:DUF2383 domain-containing protein [Candidatus Melainabacteria bacterium]
MQQQMHEPEIGLLNELLKGEISAVESYDAALVKVNESSVADILQQCRDSHYFRAERLRSTISKSGGEPVCDAGSWGSFAKMVTSAAGSAGDKAIISALEEGEDIGSNTYEWKLRDMKGENRNLIRDELWPKQKATHKLISKLAKQALGGAWPPTPETHLEA